MKRVSKLAYTAVALAAIGGAAVLLRGGDAAPNEAGFAISDDLRAGDMKKLVLHPAATPVPDVAYEGADGAEARLSDHLGSVVLLNFWATWCAPCRKEMPQLAQLARDMTPEGLVVLPLATGPAQDGAITRFLTEIGAQDLPTARSADSALARKMGVLGLPVTVLIDRDGYEVGRLTGEADWSSDSAKAILRALMARGAAGQG